MDRTLVMWGCEEWDTPIIHQLCGSGRTYYTPVMWEWEDLLYASYVGVGGPILRQLCRGGRNGKKRKHGSLKINFILFFSHFQWFLRCSCYLSNGFKAFLESFAKNQFLFWGGILWSAF